MKKRIIPIVVILTIILSLTLTACVSEGKSAYDIAVENGFVGTQTEWIESLKGDNGANGTNGTNGKDGADGQSVDIYDLYNAYLADNPCASFDEFLSAYLSIEYNDVSTAAAKGLQSAVSIYCVFERTNRPSVSGAGSGVVYQIRGDEVYIITNYHVIYYNSSYGTAKSIEVFTYGMEFDEYAVDATLVGGSITKDIAIIKASLADFESDIREVELADSNDVTLGERTVAIGNPSAEGISITSGIVSVDSEDIEMSALNTTGTVTMRVIRTDTPINSGNSGGGLYNLSGKLLGIVNAKSAETNVENIGFAIPVNVAVGIADCVIDNDAKKGVLGVTVAVTSYRTVYDTVKQRVKIIEELKIDSVTAGALADGVLEAGDILISATLNGQTVTLTRVFHLSDFLYKAREDDILTIKVERAGAEIDLTLTVTAACLNAV